MAKRSENRRRQGDLPRTIWVDVVGGYSGPVELVDDGDGWVSIEVPIPGHVAAYLDTLKGPRPSDLRDEQGGE